MKRHYLKGLVFLTAFLLASMTFSACFTPPKTYKMFGSLDEFSCFDSYEPEDIPDRSDLVKDLEIQERRCFKVNYKGTTFEVFAYVFGSDEDAATFAKRFHETTDLPIRPYDSYYIMNKDRKALLYTGGLFSGFTSSDFQQFLFENMSIEIDPFTINSIDQNSN
ncbi:MAG: hypothetical protein IKP26_06965 [Clostridia bacterium]|nr:hypothetical protein [Clostridia bacterium]